VLSFPFAVVVITECTFLIENPEIDVATRCERDGHTCWELGLEEVVLANPQTTFVLIHFSLRYSEEEIFAYFRKRAEAVNIRNVVIFVGDMNDA
jgi:ribonuclease Z